MRVKITLACTECKQRNYNTKKNKKNAKLQHPLGAYEGAGYSLKGVYRPSFDCRMRSNAHPDFCPACQKALNELIDFYTE